MCLSVPGTVIETDGARGKVDVAGNVVDADFTLTPDVELGDYVLVHAGFAIQKYDEAEALETLRMLNEVFGEGGDAPV
jgi:hydrogenase expression/formation protein HypC